MRRNGSGSVSSTLVRNNAGPPADHRRFAMATIGQGALIDDDVLLGSLSGHPQARAIEIGKAARIRGGSAIDEGVHVGDRFETGRNVSIGADTAIGDDCQVWDNAVIESDCVIGARVRVSANCVITRFTTIGDDVTIAPAHASRTTPTPEATDTRACAGQRSSAARRSG